MYSLSGGRRLARQRASSDPTPMNHLNKDGTLVGGEWGGKAADQGEHFSIRHVPDSARDCACPTVGECADKLFAWPLLIRDKNRMRQTAAACQTFPYSGRVSSLDRMHSRTVCQHGFCLHTYRVARRRVDRVTLARHSPGRDPHRGKFLSRPLCLSKNGKLGCDRGSRSASDSTARKIENSNHPNQSRARGSRAQTREECRAG
jgi:hypothetical protein